MCAHVHAHIITSNVSAAGEDYVQLLLPFNLTAESPSISISITILDDTVPEDRLEFFSAIVALNTDRNIDVEIDNTTVVIGIIDNDFQGRIINGRKVDLFFSLLDMYFQTSYLCYMKLV